MRPTGHNIRVRDLMIRPDWWRNARCADRPGVVDFFAADGNHRAAKALCSTCHVRVECLAYGLEECDGVWGGLCRSERQQLGRLKNRLQKRHDDPLNTHDVVTLVAAGLDHQQLEVVCDLDPAQSAELIAQASVMAAERTHRTLPERVAAGDPTVGHGHMSTYNAGCRCEPCREARRNDMKARRARQKRAANAA